MKNAALSAASHGCIDAGYCECSPSRGEVHTDGRRFDGRVAHGDGNQQPLAGEELEVLLRDILAASKRLNEDNSEQRRQHACTRRNLTPCSRVV